jgi:hypothetical protein
MNTKKMIQRYAWLMTGVEREAAAGREPPQQVINEMNSLYSRASAMLSPAEQQQALAAVDSLKAQFHNQAEVETAKRSARDRRYYADQFSKEITGLDYDQMKLAAKGQKFARKGRKSVDPREYESTIANVAKMLGKPEMTRKEFEQISDRYEEIKGARSPEAAEEYLAGKFGAERAAQARTSLDAYERSGIAVAVGLAERRGQDTDHYVQPSEDLELRSQIADAWAEVASRDPHTREGLSSSALDPYIEEDTLHGDIARAMLKHEMADERAEREVYTPTEYEIEDEDHATLSAF